MERLQLTDFEPHVGSIFTVTSAPQEDGIFSGTLTLYSIRPYELHPRDRRMTEKNINFRTAPFSIYFHSHNEPRLPQRMYSAHHPGFPDGLDLFLVCIADTEDETGFVYECIFN